MIQYLIQSIKNLDKKIVDEINSIDEYLIPLVATQAYYASKAEVSAKVKEGLKGKVKEHNDKHGDKKGKRVTQGMLESVFKRGLLASAFGLSAIPVSLALTISMHCPTWSAL